MAKTEIKGIDVSFNQENVDWEQVKADGVKFAILRAGFGDGNQDVMFESHIKGALDAGLDVGVYWFLYPTSAAEARNSWSPIRAKSITPFMRTTNTTVTATPRSRGWR